MDDLSVMLDLLKIDYFISERREIHAGIPFSLVFVRDGDIRVLIDGKPMKRKFIYDKQAFYYAIGYIDGEKHSS